MQDDETALIKAARNGHTETVHALLKGGANVEAQDDVKRGGWGGGDGGGVGGGDG